MIQFSFKTKKKHLKKKKKKNISQADSFISQPLQLGVSPKVGIHCL